MKFSKKISSPVAARYADAVLGLALEQKSVEAVEADMRDLAAMLEKSEDLRMLVSSPLINKETLEKAVTALAAEAGFNDLTTHTLRVLVRNGRLNALDGIIARFNTKLAAHRGEVEVSVQTAQDLNQAQRKSITQTLGKITGGKVTLDEDVNEELLAGMVVTVGSVMVDDSVSGKLQRLHAAMGRQANSDQHPIQINTT